MIDRTAGIRSKITRAKKHINDLVAAKSAFLDSLPYKVATKFHADCGVDGETIFYITEASRIPDDIPLIAGDAIHNLRSALDYLVWQLALASGGTPDRATSFPIAESFKKYQDVLPQKVRAVKNSRIVDAINTVQPYKGGNDTLWHIHALNNADKHRLLLTVGFDITKWGVTIDDPEMRELSGGLVDKGGTSWFDPIGRMRGLKEGHVLFGLPGNQTEMNEDFEFTFDIAFDEAGIFKSKPLLEALSVMAKAVENLVADFVPFLV